jgi:hypothetical protein
MKRLAALALLCGLFAINSGTAQDRRSAPPDATPPKPQRTHYTVRNADPVILAEVVGKHFKGDADIIAAPAGSGNAVLVSGSPAIVPEVVKLLEQLDRKPRTVEVEVTIAELPAPKDGKALTPADLATAEAMVKDGKGQRIKLTATEGQPVTTTIGGNKPITTSSTVAPGGGGFGRPGGAGGAGGGGPVTQKSIIYHAVGTTVKMTARVGSDDAIAMDLNVQDSKVRAPEEEGGAPGFDNNTLNTKLSIPAGKSVVAQTVRTEGKTGPTVAVVIVTARVVDPAAAKNP